MDGRGKEDKAMSYDCSITITKRKGCNCCLGAEYLYDKDELAIAVNDNDCNGNAEIVVRIDTGTEIRIEYFEINYCPICGKKLVGQ